MLQTVYDSEDNENSLLYHPYGVSLKIPGLYLLDNNQRGKRGAPAGNRTRVTSMATIYSTTRPQARSEKAVLLPIGMTYPSETTLHASRIREIVLDMILMFHKLPQATFNSLGTQAYHPTEHVVVPNHDSMKSIVRK